MGWEEMGSGVKILKGVWHDEIQQCQGPVAGMAVETGTGIHAQGEVLCIPKRESVRLKWEKPTEHRKFYMETKSLK